MELWTAFSSPLGLAVTLGVILLLVYLIYNWAYAPFQVLKWHGIKGPQPSLFFGNYKDIRQSRGIMKFSEQLYKKYGPVSGYYLGRRANILLLDLEIMKQIMVKEFNSFTEREQFPNILGRKKNSALGLSQAKGDAWRRQRQMISPTFSAAKMKAMVPLVKNSTDTLIEKLGEFAESGRSVDVYRTCQSFTMETILATAFGRVIDIQRGEADELTKTCTSLFSGFRSRIAYAELVIVLLSNFPCLAHVSRLLLSSFIKKNDLDVLHSTALGLVKARRQEGKSKHKDLLQLMIDATEGEDGGEGKLSDEEIVANSILFLLAGFETTANALAYTSYLLALNPEKQEKLQTEIDEYFESKPEASMYSATQELQYLDMVIQETLRLYPTAPRTSRVAQKTIEINGVTIPEGVNVQLPIHLIHYNPEIWPEPEKFDPERFTPEEKAKRPALCHIPFGWGPRNCVGMRFALMEVKMALIEILQKYKFVRTPETEVPLKTDEGGSSTAPVNGVFLGIVRRD